MGSLAQESFKID